MASTRPRQGRHIRVRTVALRARVGKRDNGPTLSMTSAAALCTHSPCTWGCTTWHHGAWLRSAPRTVRTSCCATRPPYVARCGGCRPATDSAQSRTCDSAARASPGPPGRPHARTGTGPCARQWALTHPPHSSAKRRITSPAFGMLPPGGAHSVARLAGSQHASSLAAALGPGQCPAVPHQHPAQAASRSGFCGSGTGGGINSTAGGLTDYLRATTERQTSCRGTALSHGLARWRRCVLRLPCSRSTFRFRRN